MDTPVEANIGEWIYKNGNNSRGIQIWDTEWDHYMNLFYSKKRESWVCKGFADDCYKSATECHHAQILNNLSKEKDINSTRELVRSKCNFCDTVFIPKENYKQIQSDCAKFYIKELLNEIWNETVIEIIILKCGHIYHKECYDDKCHLCDD